MSIFSELSKKSLIKALITKDTPVYVQFYITARCNLACSQCNIIYANSDVEEISLSGIERIADNLAAMRVAIVLLTGGEPFVRTDLPEIIQAFTSRGVHVRMQTNGYATEEAICAAIEAGGRDISISLDSLDPAVQDSINGNFPGSWSRALKAIETFSRYLDPATAFASLGCVMQPVNLRHIPSVIEFGSKIGWFTSLVPIHTTRQSAPLGFRTFNKNLRFQESDFPSVVQVVERVRSMKKEGYWLYDSDQYLDDIKRFLTGHPIEWRDKNGGVCDSPNLYFAIRPNGDFAPCCDFRHKPSVSVADKNFPEIYRSQDFRNAVSPIVRACSGCMYGSYPEVTITFRYLQALAQRAKVFFTDSYNRPWPLTGDLEHLAASLRNRQSEIEEVMHA